MVFNALYMLLESILVLAGIGYSLRKRNKTRNILTETSVFMDNRFTNTLNCTGLFGGGKVINQQRRAKKLRDKEGEGAAASPSPSYYPPLGLPLSLH